MEIGNNIPNSATMKIAPPISELNLAILEQLINDGFSVTVYNAKVFTELSDVEE